MHPKLAHVVGGTVTQTEQTVNLPPHHSSTERAESSFRNWRFCVRCRGSFTDDSTPSAEASRLSGKALYKIQVQRLIDIRVVFREKEEERRLQMCVVDVGVCRVNTRYASHVPVSKVRSTHLRDTRPNRHNSSLPKLQCAGRRSENLYVTSPTTSAAC